MKQGPLTFKTNKTGDYHEQEDMNADVFEDYFEQMLKYLPAGSVVILDYASFHPRRVPKTPTSSWGKQGIIDWFISEDIPFQLIVNLHKHRFMKYTVEDIAEKYNITVLRLPPYYCELNPIELIWAQLKGFVARGNI